MAWDEQRRMRGAHTDDTATIAAAPAPAGGDAPPPPPVRRGGPGFEAWGRRFGWMVAVGVSAVALLLSGIALANSGGSDHARFRAGGMRFGAPGVGDGRGYGYGYRAAPGGSGTGTPSAPSGPGPQFPAPGSVPSR